MVVSEEFLRVVRKKKKCCGVVGVWHKECGAARTRPCLVSGGVVQEMAE